MLVGAYAYAIMHIENEHIRITMHIATQNITDEKENMSDYKHYLTCETWLFKSTRPHTLQYTRGSNSLILLVPHLIPAGDFAYELHGQ